MSLRLAQWPEAAAGTRPTLLSPASLIKALDSQNELEWQLLDNQETLELTGGEGSGYMQVHRWREIRERVPTARLLTALTQGGYELQFFWGELRAYRPKSSEPELSISAFDSTSYDIEGSAEMLARVEALFAWAQFPD